MANGKGNEVALIGSISSVTQKVPGTRGVLDFGNEVGVVTNKYPIIVLEQDPVERSFRMREFKQFITDEFGYPRTIKFQSSDEPDVYYWAKVSASPVPTQYNGSSDFVLTVTNTEATKYSVAEADEILWGSQVITFSSNILLSHDGSGATDLQVSANTSFTPEILGMAVMPYLILEGSGTNVVFSCDGKTIRVGTFSGILEIDTAERVAYLNDVEQFMRMDAFYLKKNTPVSVTGTNMNFVLNCHYRDEM